MPYPNLFKTTKQFDVNRLIGDLKSDVKIPNQSHGDFTISHKKLKVGEKVPVVTLRSSIFMGYQATTLLLDRPMTLTVLEDKDGVWMNDHPQEIFLHSPAIDAAFGDVLIGGLGIGYSTQKIADKKEVKSVTVVEKSEPVLAMVVPYLKRNNVTTVCTDLFDYLKHTTQKYDYCFFDIWRGTGERDLDQSVIPLREAAKRVLKPGGVVKCWGEEEMEGQRKMKQHFAPISAQMATEVRRKNLGATA